MRQIRNYITVDRAGLELAALFALVLGLTTLLTSGISPDAAAAVGPPESFGSGTAGEASASAAWVVAEVAFAATLLGLVLVYRRLPEWLQHTAKGGVIIAILMLLGVRLSTVGIPLVLGLYVGYRVFDHVGLWWLANNALAVGLAVFIGIGAGLLFGVVGMAIALLALSLYDHVFANKQLWMFALATPIMKARLPVLFIRPTSWRHQWGDIMETLTAAEDGDDSETDESAWGIGMADLGLPAAFVAAVMTAPTSGPLVGGAGPALAVAVGVCVACFRVRYEMLTRGSGAGLPPLTAGALAGYALVAAPALFGAGIL